MGLIGAAALAIGALSFLHTSFAGVKRMSAREDVDTVYNTYLNNLNSLGINDLNTKDAIDHLRALGYISVEDYEKALDEYAEFERQYADSQPIDLWYDMSTSSKKFKSLANIYEKLNEHSNVFANAARLTSDQLKGSIKEAFDSTLNNIHDVAAPSYFDTTFANESKNAKPMRLMTGQEMADLHSLDYDPNTYYDLVKQGTEAKVNYADYLSQQMNEASMIDDTKNTNTYLDSIRNNKAEALASGATAGARAAQEVLNTQEAINNYATNQATIANNRYKTVEQALLDDASAKLTAKDYFNTLAQSLSTDALTLYTNDAERYRGEQSMYGGIYAANELLRQANIRANGSMAGNYIANQASINANRAGVKDQQTELDWIYDRVLGANEGNTLKANLQLNNIIRNDALGYGSYVDNYNKYYR